MTSSLELFAPTAARFRRYQRIARVAAALFLASFALSVFLGQGSVIYLYPFAIVSLIALAAAGFALPKLACPACSARVERASGFYCPVCGGQGVSDIEGTVFSPRHCMSCESDLFRTRAGRNFKVRYCTHCGTQLDIEGV